MDMKNWKTTLGGLVAAIGPIVAPVLPPQWSWIGAALTALGTGFLGYSAKDSNVTGGTVKQ